VLLELIDIRVHYGKVEVLKGVSLGIEKGSIVTLIGSNGAGKTTTLKTISGIKRPTTGEIWFDGQRIDKTPPQDIVRLGIAHVPEGRRVFSPLTVLENLEMGAYLRRNRTETAKSLEYVYKRFPILKERQKQAAGSLSGGEQQMLVTARALMTRPKLLLMDEPSIGLSPMLVQEVAGIIRDINQGGVSIILVEQNARMALKLANEAYVLDIGRIAFQGNAKDLENDERVIKTYLGG
jgi:branched-chain amino acid transport system ATP-binding protein